MEGAYVLAKKRTTLKKWEQETHFYVGRPQILASSNYLPNTCGQVWDVRARKPALLHLCWLGNGEEVEGGKEDDLIRNSNKHSIEQGWGMSARRLYKAHKIIQSGHAKATAGGPWNLKKKKIYSGLIFKVMVPCGCGWCYKYPNGLWQKKDVPPRLSFC